MNHIGCINAGLLEIEMCPFGMAFVTSHVNSCGRPFMGINLLGVFDLNLHGDIRYASRSGCDKAQNHDPNHWVYL